MNETEYQKLWKKVKEGKLPNKYEIRKDILYRKKDDKLLKVIRRHEWEALMYMMHDAPTSAHFGVRATYNKTKERYNWKGMLKDIETYVKSCDQCQKRGKSQGKNELHPIQVKAPFYQIGIDIVGPLPKTSKGNKFIVVVVDYFTKWPEAKAIPAATSKEVADFIYEDIICRHGCPQKILSDRGSHFNNQMIEALTNKFKIKHNFSTPYHPKTNGLVERFNKTLGTALAKLQKVSEWDENIPSVLFAYRTKIQDTSKVTPAYLTYGRKLRQPFDEEEIKETSLVERCEWLIDEIPKEHYKAKKHIEESQRKQKEYFDKKNKRKPKFKIGTKVLYYLAAKEKTWTGKLDEKWKGPYFIHEVLLNGSYKLKELEGKVLKTPVSGELLKEYYGRESFEPLIVV